MKKLMIAGLSSLLLTPLSALAYEQGDMLVRAGVTSVEPDDSAKPDGVKVKENSQLGVNFVYMTTNTIGIEVLASTPFKHDIATKAGTTIGTTKHLPPTVSVQYYFNKTGEITPYVGAGLNYTVFFDEKLNNGTKLELKNSAGLALQVGADYAINDKWGVNLDIRKIDIETEVTSTTAKGTEVQVDPMVYSLTALYKF